jgi:hypothetical protein
MSDKEYLGQQQLERSLLIKRIARVVSEAKRNNKPVSSYHAAHFFADFPNANMSIRDILEELRHAAADAGVEIE